MALEAGRLTMKNGNKSLVIGQHFIESSMETLSDNVKKIFKKDDEDGFLKASGIWEKVLTESEGRDILCNPEKSGKGNNIDYPHI